MKITLYGEHAFRVLVYLAEHSGHRCTIGEIAAACRVNENHLRQVVFHLGKAGIVRTYRGKGGGLELAWSPSSINLERVFRTFERDLGPVDFEPLVPVMQEALDAYLAVPARYTLEDVLTERQ
jgi:Rrf2 family nitric oxide-sensitive transcriptional repressor